MKVKELCAKMGDELKGVNKITLIRDKGEERLSFGDLKSCYGEWLVDIFSISDTQAIIIVKEICDGGTAVNKSGHIDFCNSVTEARKREYEDKKGFIDKYVAPLITGLYPAVENVRYRMNLETGEEYIDIDKDVTICVTADSKACIVYDVMRKLI